MAGLLGSMVAGGVKGYADSRVSTLEKQEDFNLKKMLMDAEVEKTMMLKKLGYELDDERTAKQAEKRAGYFNDVEESTTTPESIMQKYTDENGVEQVVKSGGETVTKSRPASVSDAAERAFKSGDFEGGEGLLKLGAKEAKGYESIKLDDGTIVSFDKSTGATQVAYQGEGKSVQYKTIEEAIVNEQDPVKRAELISIKTKIAAAGRAPKADSNIDEAYKDWKSKPENKGKGRDDFEQLRARWGKDDGLGVQEVTEKPLFNQFTGEPVLDRKTGKPIKETAVKRKEKVPPTGGLKKDKDGNYVWTR